MSAFFILTVLHVSTELEPVIINDLTIKMHHILTLATFSLTLEIHSLILVTSSLTLAISSLNLAIFGRHFVF